MTLKSPEEDRCMFSKVWPSLHVLALPTMRYSVGHIPSNHDFSIRAIASLQIFSMLLLQQGNKVGETNFKLLTNPVNPLTPAGYPRETNFKQVNL